MKKTTILLALAIVATGSLQASDSAGERWSQWRGPSRSGEVGGPEWPASLDQLADEWSVELGKGYSGPVVSEYAVFVAETINDETEGMRAYDRFSGREIWSTSWPGQGEVPFFAKKNGDWIRSTPTFDGDSLFIGGMEEVLHRIDAASGRIVWSINFPESYGTPVPDFGFASSPLVDGDHLFVQAANSIVKIDKRSGETRWRALVSETSMMSNGAFSSPVLATLAGRRHLLVQTRHTLYGLDPISGQVFWSRDVPNFRGMNILTPTVWKDSIFTSSYRNGTHLFTVTVDADSRPMISETWTYKSPGYMSSPVVIDDSVYLHLGNGRLTSIDLKTGDSHWTSPPLGDYWSLAFQGDKILALTEAGDLHLPRADQERLEIVGTVSVADQSTWGHIAVDDGQIFVRELQGLRALRLESVPTAVPSR